MPYSEYFREDLSPIEFVNRINASMKIEHRETREQFEARPETPDAPPDQIAGTTYSMQH